MHAETPELTRAREVAVIVAHVSEDLKFDLINNQRNPLSQLLLRVLASRDKVTLEPAYAHVYGTTGTGKTEVLRSVHKHAAASGAACEIAAFSARAALRLGGCTALGLFGIDPDGNHTGGDISAKLPDLDAVLIDDAHLLKASQLDAMHAQLLERGFRGVVVLAADASQLGPVVGGRDIDHAQQLANSLHSARCWEHFRRGYRLLLAKQVRITDVTLAEAVVQIARGSEGSSSCGALRRRTVLLPRHIFPMTAVHSDCDVRDAQQWVCRRSPGQCDPVAGSIVCTKNERVNEHNAAVLRQQPGQLRKYEALDCSSTSAGSMRSVPSWSTKQNTSNYSDVLELKLGVPARVTLTVDRSHGVVTDALVWVEELCDNFVVVQLADMPGRHGRVKLHRARFRVYVPEQSRLVERLQFPLKLAWAVTAHKAPAFEPARVLVDLRNECWLHGQLAVMLSRVARSTDMRVLVHPHSIQGDCIKTTNVVLHDIIESVEGHVS